jgi:serralysin
MADIPGSASTGASIGVGGSLTNSLEVVGDHDWFAITLTAGQSISITMAGSGGTPLEDPYLRLRDSLGNQVAFNDDGAGNRNAQINFTATTSGVYYIDASSWSDPDAGYPGYTGTYQLSVGPYTPPPVFDYDQIADQLINGYWESVGGSARHFNVSEGGTITVNLTGLTSAGQYLARHALELWSDSLGIRFQETTGTAQITFQDDDGDSSDDAAFSSSVTSGNLIISSDVNIDTGWITGYGTSLNSYSFQTYLHEIGHALGLGHAGDYNGTADYMQDALYQNDAWSTTVMSYFSQEQNSYFSNRGFTYDYVVTPMVGDLVAMSLLYGTPTTTRTGDTTYGFHSNANRDVFNATLNPDVAYTVIDSGGVDTLDYSGFSAAQRIDLNAEAFSNVGGGVGNVAIARGTVIENATGGSGNDVLVGNAANNVLIGNGGNDSLSGGSGNDTASYATTAAGVTVSLAVATAQNTGGSGIDTLNSIENLIGSAFNDSLTGNGAANILEGGAGNDVLAGGGGVDTAIYSGASDRIVISLAVASAQNTRSQGYDTLSSIENVVGTAFNDSLTGNSAANVLSGGDGNDVFTGGAGNDTIQGGNGVDRMEGGAGDDVLAGGADIDTAMYRSATSAVTVNLALTGAQNTGGSGVDTLTGIERLTGSNFSDSLTGNSDANVIYGANGNDTINGGAGMDRLQGDGGADILNGGDGNDVLVGVAGNDSLNGGDGFDRLYGGAGDDSLNGGTGYDILYYAGSTSGVTVNLGVAGAQNTGGGGIDTIAGFERLIGTVYDDSLTGSNAADMLQGAAGNDVVVGGGGNDRVIGDAGNETVDGGTGIDRLYGGAGQDNFRFDTALSASTNWDYIADYAVADDTIQLSQSVFSAIAAGGLAASAFRLGTSAADSSDRIVYDQAHGFIYYDADGNGGGQQVLFARVAAGTALTNADFSVFGAAQTSLGSASVQTALTDPVKTAPAAISDEAQLTSPDHLAFVAATSFSFQNFHTADHYII